MKGSHGAAAFAAAIVCLVSLPGCKLARLKRVRVEPESVKVTVQLISESSSVNVRSYVGTVESAKAATLSATHLGTLRSLPVHQGQKVSAGQVVAQIYSAAVTSSFNAASSSFNQARDAFKRASQVYGSGSISEVKMVEIRTRLDQAQASFDAARNALEECKITAPFAATVADVFVQQGEKVSIGQPILSIMDMSGLEVSISVPENEIGTVLKGSRARITFPSLEDASGVSLVRTAVLKSRDVMSNTLSHSYKCTFALDSPVPSLMAGMVCKVFLEKDSVSGIVIPADVVKVDSEGKYVWVVEDETVVKRRIATGPYSGSGVMVSNGLRIGDMLIVEGAGKVSGGMKVSICCK